MKDNDKRSVRHHFKYYLVVGIICLMAAGMILFVPERQKESKPVNLSEHSSVYSICELATQKSFYHNVAMYEKEPEGGDKFVNDYLLWPFGQYAKVGYKQFWLEYSGVVETGIEANAVQIGEPDEQGVVRVFVPDAKVLNVYADESSLSEPYSENGWFTSISGEEKTKAFAAAQIAMRSEAENDENLLNRAKENAKTLMEKYIVNTGKMIGIDLSVEWLEKPDEQI